MAVTCEACGHWSLTGEHSCPALWARFAEKAARKQIVIQLPDKPGAEYDDLLIALTRLAETQANKAEDDIEWRDPEAHR